MDCCDSPSAVIASEAKQSRHLRRPRDRDCCVARCAPRNDSVGCRATPIRVIASQRVRPIASPMTGSAKQSRGVVYACGRKAAERSAEIKCGLSRQLTRCLGVIAFEKARRERDRRRAPAAHRLLHESCRKARSQGGSAKRIHCSRKRADDVSLIRPTMPAPQRSASSAPACSAPDRRRWPASAGRPWSATRR